MLNQTELIFITDTLCGWCNIARPAAGRLFETFHEQMSFTMLHRRLFTEHYVPEMNEYFLQNVRRVGWERAPKMMGRPFTDAYWELIQQESFQHNSHLTSLAIAAASSFLDKDNTTRFAERLQSLVFDEGRDPNEYDTFAMTAAEFGIDDAAYKAEFSEKSTSQKAVVDAKRAEQIQVVVGSQGVPLLILRQGNNLTKLNPFNYDQTAVTIKRAIDNACIPSKG